MPAFADMISYLRRRDGLSQQQLADMLGVKRSTISMYETGKREPDFETAEALADIFNVNMDTLLGKDCTDQQITTAPTVRVSPERQELLDMVDSLTDEEVTRLLQIARLVTGG